jgi:hypothetical protein
MTPRIRKLTLTTHVIASVGWLGAVASFLVLAVTGLTSQDAQMMRATYLATNLITWYIIIPLCFASLLSGIIQSLGTRWGLFQHYWIVVKLLLTTLSTILLMVHTRPIGYLAAVAAQMTIFSEDHHKVQIQLVITSGAALLVLLVNTTLSIYKPQGLTRYGWRKQQEQRSSTSAGCVITLKE